MAARTLLAVVVSLGSALSPSAQVAAQAAPAPGGVEPPPLLVVEPPAPTAPAAPPSAGAVDVRALTEQLLALEAQAVQLEAARARIRVRGMRIGKIISWTATGLMLASAFGAYGTAEQIKEAIEDGRDDKAYDSDGDKDVDKDDEQRSRRVARGLAISSLVPIGLGVWTSIMYKRRLNQQRDLGFQLDDLALRRRSLLQRVGADLGISQQHAELQLQLRF